ncbi:hypothetical protein F4776DRAFT_588811 [Hypoxylon sp. NC0597]|nr:hypothetical protein F4776DRAFT_588811 [Hypoxylon sp. NC0597]
MAKSSKPRPVSDPAIRQADLDATMQDVPGSPTTGSPSLGNSPSAHPESPHPGRIQTPRSSRSSSTSSIGSFASHPSPTPTPASPSSRIKPTNQTDQTNQHNPPLPGFASRLPNRRPKTPAYPGFGTPGGGFVRTATPSGSPVLLGRPRQPPSSAASFSSSGHVYTSGSAVSSRLRSSVMSGDLNAPHTPPDAATPTDQMPGRRRNNRVVPRDPRRGSLLFGASVASRGGTPRDGSTPLGWTPPSMKGKGKGMGRGGDEDQEEDDENEE